MIGRLIVKSRLAASQPPLDNPELIAQARAWSEILDGEVPEKDLESAYVRAMRDKETGFALSAPELVQGFRAFCVSERTAPQIAQNSNLLVGAVCPRCHGSGMEMVTAGPDDRYSYARRCDHVIAEVQKPSVIVDEDQDVDTW